MNRTEIICKLESAHNEYFDLFLKNYPKQSDEDNYRDFGPAKLYELAIEVHACATALGPRAFERLHYVGLDFLYPFDNLVDFYSWRVNVKKNDVSHTIYAAIAIRIDSELQRMRRILELGGDIAYDALQKKAFLVSKNRYEITKDATGAPKARPPNAPEATCLQPSIALEKSLPDTDHQAVSKLERLEASTAIGAHVSAIVSVLRSVFGN
ncbi:hypothetical protein [Xanthomonas sacchari]|uniref:hypothetical protein n=1 Tax=Xanthomonas sacchari TaxID=56458 RepID=UPI00352768DB